jgi:hypothetical protein
MLAPLAIDTAIVSVAAVLAISSVVRPENRRLRIAAVLALVGVTLIYGNPLLTGPSARAAVVYYEQHGGVPSAAFRDGVSSLQAVTWPFSMYVLVATTLLAAIVLRRK